MSLTAKLRNDNAKDDQIFHKNSIFKAWKININKYKYI